MPELGPEAGEEVVAEVAAAVDIAVVEVAADIPSAFAAAVVAFAAVDKERGHLDKHRLRWGQQEQEPGMLELGERQTDRMTLVLKQEQLGQEQLVQRRD